MPSQMMHIADRLGDLYKGVKGIQIEMGHQEKDLAARVLVLAGDGWPGKNDDQRKTAKENAIAGDEACQKIRVRIAELGDDLADAEGEISALREQRDALCWQTRERFVAALEVKYGVTPAPMREPVDGAFDGEQDAEAEAMAAEDEDSRRQPVATIDDDPIPF